MSIKITRKKLFLKIKCKKEGLYPNVRLADPEFAKYAEDAIFLLLERDKENISASDTSKISKFLTDFVHRCRSFWKAPNVQSKAENMFRNHRKYFEDEIDFGNLNPEPPEANIVVVEEAVGPQNGAVEAMEVDQEVVAPGPVQNPAQNPVPEGC